MAKNVDVINYDSSMKEKWDKFVLNDSMNGTFLQTYQFYDYHPVGRFKDESLIFMNGNNIIAVLPACILIENGKKTLFSHKGSTFGGLIISKKCLSISYLDLIFEKLDEYLKNNNYDEIILKQPGKIYLNSESELLDYYLFMNGYSASQEVGYYIDYSNYNDDIISNFTSSKRRDYRYSLKNELKFKKLDNKDELKEFYEILCDNYTKFGHLPVHTLDELIDFKYCRLQDNTDFYGVYLGAEMIAGSMIFKFAKKIFHTQYLAVKQDKTNLFANEFLYKNLIEVAKNEGFKMMSFGTSTLDGGKVLNRKLAQYKEGFGTTEYVNRTYSKILI